VAIFSKYCFIDVSDHSLTFFSERTCGSLEYVAEEQHPSFEGSEVSKILRRGDMEGRVECLEDFVQERGGDLAEVGHDLLDNYL
jgi:hypothetical protein